MPYADKLVRVSIHFTLGTPSVDEEAQFGYFLSLDDADTPVTPVDWADSIQTIADDIRTKTDTWWTATRAQFPSAVKIDRVKAAHIDSNGHVLHQGEAATALTTTRPGSATGSLPFQCSRVITMYGYDPGTFVADRRRKRGRVYLPPESFNNLDANGRFDTGPTAAIANAWDAYMEDIQGMHAGPVGGDHLDVVVASTTGIKTQVEAYGIGDVPDTQRRRRRSRTEVVITRDLSHE
jgi:hypothetical protein